MTTKINILLFLATLLLACNQPKNEPYAVPILGEWDYVDCESFYVKTMVSEWKVEQDLTSFRGGFIFNPNDSCERKVPYFIRIKNNEELRFTYHGYKTTYKFKKDSLCVFDVSSQSWECHKIVSLVGDTLKMSLNDSLIARYVRNNFVVDKRKLFDICVVSSARCQGSCPINDIIIKNTGDVLYYGYKFNTKNGYFTSKITTAEFAKIEENFKKARIMSLESDYPGPVDDHEVTMTFIKDGKIIKSISDGGRTAPPALQYAYMPLVYFSQYRQLDTLANFPEYFGWMYFEFEKGDWICQLTKSETFYLKTLLAESKITNKKPQSKYKIGSLFDKKSQNMISDGRFFQFETASNQTITLDLGYNFLERHNFLTKFEKKKVYPWDSKPPPAPEKRVNAYRFMQKIPGEPSEWENF